MINPLSIAIGTAVNTAVSTAKAVAKETTSSSKNKTYKELDKEFENKYKKEIEGISRYNNVDLGVAKEMFKTNLRYEDGLYGGGGVAENWGEMLTDFKKLNENLWTTSKERETSTNTSRGTTSIGNNISAGSVAGSGIGFNDDTIGVVVGVGVLYMFLSLFRR